MKRYCSLILAILISFICICSASATQPIIADDSIYKPVSAKNGMVVTGDNLAAKEALKVLKEGGNAIDAAVAAGFVMAVTMPRAGNIGGGGFMLIYSAKEGRVVAIDYRERAPLNASRDMFIDKDGNADNELSRFSHLSAGVPGTVAGFALALEKYGTLSLKEVLGPAIKYAKKGFIVSEALAEDIKRASERLKKWPATAKIFFKKDGSYYESGDRFIQKDLAKTLTMIAKKGAKGFYEGPLADLIVEEMEREGGLITKADLLSYKPRIRAPVRGNYRGYDIYSMPPPSSGGTHLIQIMNILEGYKLRKWGHNSAGTIHHMAEGMKFAYADRSEYLGDPDFYEMPINAILSKVYSNNLRKKISNKKANPSRNIAPGELAPYESDETTHYVVADNAGNVVSNTYTINFSFGSGIVVPGAGFLLNNEMDDFSAKPGVPNAYGLIGGEVNKIEAKKRMLSSMSPTIVLKGGKPFLATGSPGGSRIITTTLQVILNVIDHGMNIQEAVNAPRVHHQWLPDELRVEKGLSPDTVKLLEQKGHKVLIKRSMGAASSIMIDNETGLFYGAADPRREGLAKGY
ncbi:MAG: gamma-glutamyltransferase [Deltaproteobacteria bacterium]|nr:gamma-glutamyltransferase [Deltaproteobacteria bacterium]